jgi:cyanophycinase-like exopeptidase
MKELILTLGVGIGFLSGVLVESEIRFRQRRREAARIKARISQSSAIIGFYEQNW